MPPGASRGVLSNGWVFLAAFGALLLHLIARRRSPSCPADLCPGGGSGRAAGLVVAPSGKMKLLFISLEYEAGTFSGNGVYAQSQVKSLERQGHEVLVISGRPKGEEEPMASGVRRGDRQAPDATLSNKDGAPAAGGRVITTPLPVWGRLDHLSGWEVFGEAGAQELVCEEVLDFVPDVVLGVDWHARPVFDRLVACMEMQGLKRPPYVYLNYRVYSRQEEARTFLEEKERAAAAGAAAVIVLCRQDAQHIPALLPSGSKLAPLVLLPPLRDDMKQLAVAAGGSGRERRFLTCCVRISPEKEPERFVALVEALAARGVLAELQLVPLLVAAAQTDVAKALAARVRTAAPGAVIVTEFMPPDRMTKEVYAHTRLNVHPCVYDAYGMTIVEAAAMGAPSLMQRGGEVGAGDLLGDEEAFKVDLNPAGGVGELADGVAALLRDTEALRRVGEAAKAKALSWDLGAYGREFESMIRGATSSSQ